MGLPIHRQKFHGATKGENTERLAVFPGQTNGQIVPAMLLFFPK